MTVFVSIPPSFFKIKYHQRWRGSTMKIIFLFFIVPQKYSGIDLVTLVSPSVSKPCQLNCVWIDKTKRAHRGNLFNSPKIIFFQQTFSILYIYIFYFIMMISPAGVLRRRLHACPYFYRNPSDRNWDDQKRQKHQISTHDQQQHLLAKRTAQQVNGLNCEYCSMLYNLVNIWIEMTCHF